MLSGRDTLKRMDKTLRRARRDLDRLDSELKNTSRAITENRLAQARAIDRMAGIRLDAARRGEVVEQLESATREAESILEERETAIAGMADRVAEAQEAVETLEARRETLHEQVDDAARTLAEREGAVQQGLTTDPAFAAQLARTEQAEAVAARADEKAELAEADRRRKGKPFESDELFMYLWQREYATSGYSAGPLTRLLDGWVAGLCGFREARSNYWMLLEIPKRLAEHAEFARDAADEELEKLKDIEEQAAKDGEVPEAREALASLESRQDALDSEIDTAEQRLSELQAEHGRFSSGDDEFLLRALRVFSAAMEQRAVGELTQLARATMTPEDDSLVEELRYLRRQSAMYEAELRENRELQDTRQARIRELEKVRKSFKQSRYDDLHSQFDKSDLIERMIGDVVGGLIQGGVLWKTLKRYQRYIDAAGEWPDFGSGGFPQPKKRKRPKFRSRPPSWHSPGSSRSSRSGGGFNLPRPPKRSSRGRGGFKTGGGF